MWFLVPAHGCDPAYMGCIFGWARFVRLCVIGGVCVCAALDSIKKSLMLFAAR
jgi:hypothetical protein